MLRALPGVTPLLRRSERHILAAVRCPQEATRADTLRVPGGRVGVRAPLRARLAAAAPNVLPAGASAPRRAVAGLVMGMFPKKPPARAVGFQGVVTKGAVAKPFSKPPARKMYSGAGRAGGASKNNKYDGELGFIRGRGEQSLCFYGRGRSASRVGACLSGTKTASTAECCGATRVLRGVPDERGVDS